MAFEIEAEWMAQAASVVGISHVCGQEWMPVEVVEEAEAVDVVVPVRVVEMAAETSAIVFDGAFLVDWVDVLVLCAVCCVIGRIEDRDAKREYYSV